jgi:hypothetical protein
LLEEVVQIAKHLVPRNRIGMVGVEHMHAGGLRKEGGAEGSVILHIPISGQNVDSALMQALERRRQGAGQYAFSRSGSAGDSDYNTRCHTDTPVRSRRPSRDAVGKHPNRCVSIPLVAPACAHARAHEALWCRLSATRIEITRMLRRYRTVERIG